jgi:hypothetical protein
LDLRGFWMTRDEAARWLDAIDPPSADDSHPTRGDIVKAARPKELLFWARANRDNTLRGRALCAIYLAAWRGCRTSLDVETQRITEAVCDATGEPCNWLSEEWCDDNGEIALWDCFCGDCGRWRDWSRDEAPTVHHALANTPETTASEEKSE